MMHSIYFPSHQPLPSFPSFQLGDMGEYPRNLCIFNSLKLLLTSILVSATIEFCVVMSLGVKIFYSSLFCFKTDMSNEATWKRQHVNLNNSCINTLLKSSYRENSATIQQEGWPKREGEGEGSVLLIDGLLTHK